MLDSWPKHEMGIAACYGVTAAIALILTRFEGGIALMWPANALVACMLIRAPRVRWFSMIALLFAAGMLTNAVAANRDLQLAITFTCLNGLEMALMVWIFRRVVHYDYPDIRIDQSAVMTVICGVAIPGLVSLAAGWTLATHLGLTFVDVASQWWSSHTLGACLIGPPVILSSTRALRRLVGSEYWVANAAMLIGTLVGSWISIRYIRFPFVVISVLLLTSAFRVGGFGASLLSLSTSLTIAALWAIGVRPVGLERLPVNFSLAGLPVIALLATTMPPIAVGLGTDARRAVARKLHSSERRFRESMEHSPIGMLIANLDGVWGYTNLACKGCWATAPMSCARFRRVGRRTRRNSPPPPSVSGSRREKSPPTMVSAASCTRRGTGCGLMSQRPWFAMRTERPCT